MKTPVWVVTNVQPQKDYTLILTFASREKKLFDARPLLAKAIYKPLNNLSFFLTAKADCGSVAWSDEIDIAPEYLYEYSLPLQVSADVLLRTDIPEVNTLYKSEFAEVLADCTPSEIDSILKIVKEVKRSMHNPKQESYY